jgi:hypothetical protein
VIDGRGSKPKSSWRVVGIVAAIAALASACSRPPLVTPMSDSARRPVSAISAEVWGTKDSDTSTIGARGRAEASERAATQGALAVAGNGGPLGLLLAPFVGAAVGSTTGASGARPEPVVDETRANLRLAMQETDLGELLRSRLLAAGAAGQVEIVAATTGSGTAPLQAPNGKPVDQVLALEYKVEISHTYQVNPTIGLFATVKAHVTSPDRKSLIHTATWIYCGRRMDFVKMGANQAAALRAELDRAAAILAEAIPYDLYVSSQPRPLRGALCNDFSGLPSGRPAPPPQS